MGMGVGVTEAGPVHIQLAATDRRPRDQGRSIRGGWNLAEMWEVTADALPDAKRSCRATGA